MTAPTGQPSALDAGTIAALNDLLQLDHDAIHAYTLAIGSLKNVGRRETLVRFRVDHERHVADLTRLVRRYGGTPVESSHDAARPFTVAMEKLGAHGGDHDVIVAYRSNARDSRDRYAKAAARAASYPQDVRDAIVVAADDEARHCEWAESQLETLGAPPEGTAVRVTDAVERAGAHGRRGVGAIRRGATAARERLAEERLQRVLVVGLAAAAVGLVLTVGLATALRRRR